ncbi:hypothetical protein KBY75_14615, partial [Cyanobium sp. T1G-Tous]|uniref:hypothetical protein n=1 Tax=Cyanobium sp. T1G-Tous TaxID=2823722 RepID=UPI0020CF69F0
QAVTLAYTDASSANDSSGVIEDAAGNDLASFSARSVTNASTDLYLLGNYNNHTYALSINNRSWTDARTNALTSGGYLAEISGTEENDALFDLVTNWFNGHTINGNPPYDISYASDGGNSSYVWIGGSDATSEGDWRWSKTNAQIALNRTEWGSGQLGQEPDNGGGTIEQDHLALGMENWPYLYPDGAGFGDAGQWNDLNGENRMFSVIEFDSITAVTMEDQLIPQLNTSERSAKRVTSLSFDRLTNFKSWPAKPNQPKSYISKQLNNNEHEAQIFDNQRLIDITRKDQHTFSSLASAMRDLAIDIDGDGWILRSPGTDHSFLPTGNYI